MTEEEKITRMLKAQEVPELYSDKEIDDILEDISDISNLKRAFADEDARKENVNVNGAWEKFVIKARLSADKEKGNYSWLKVAASVVGIIFVGIAAYAASIGLGIVSNPFHAAKDEVQHYASKTTSPIAERTVNFKDSLPVAKTESEKESTKVISFDNEELGNILSQIAVFYKVKVNYNNDTVIHIRLHFNWDQEKSLDDIIMLLNSFKQINVTREGDVLTVDE